MFLTVLLSLSLSAAPNRAALAPFTLAGVDPALGQLLEDSLAQSLRKRGLEVVTRQDTVALLGFEQQKHLLGCEESSACMAELVSALGCEQLVVTSLGKVEGGYRGVTRILSTRDGHVRREASVAAATTGALIEAFADAAAELMGQHPAPTSTVVRWVPAMVGAAALGAAGALFASSGARYERVVATGDATVANEGRALQVGAWTAVGVGLAGVGWSVVWVALGRQPPPISVAYSPEFGVSVQGALP